MHQKQHYALVLFAHFSYYVYKLQTWLSHASPLKLFTLDSFNGTLPQPLHYLICTILILLVPIFQLNINDLISILAPEMCQMLCCCPKNYICTCWHLISIDCCVEKSSILPPFSFTWNLSIVSPLFPKPFNNNEIYDLSMVFLIPLITCLPRKISPTLVVPNNAATITSDILFTNTHHP